MLRRSLSTPIPEIFAAAGHLSEAVDCHIRHDFENAERLFAAADDPVVWNYTDRAWGKGCALRYGFLSLDGAPPHLPIEQRSVPRMPGTAVRKAALERDGHHCRFCSIPVIDPGIRRLIMTAYPDAVRWGATNESQHAGFQCMWLQFDHILPNSRGGDSSLDNIVITCAPCNFGRMHATLEEARLVHPLTLDPPVAWERFADWDGLERLRSVLPRSGISLSA